MTSHRRWALAAVLLCTVLAYLPAMRGPFEFDDISSIPGNTSIRSLADAFSPPPNTSVSGRPVVNLTFALNRAINDVLDVDQRPEPYGPNKTLGFHIVNLALHLLCGLLLFALVRRTSGDDWLAIGATALWLLHPIQSEAVNYLVQRTELLVSFCCLLTLFASMRAWDAVTRRRRVAWQSVAVIACLLGMGSKEVMIVAPLLVVLYDRAFRVTTWRALRGRAVLYAMLASTVLVVLWGVASDARFATAGFDAGMAWYRYLYSQMWAIAHYLRLVLWPSGFAVDYGYRAVAGARGIPGGVLLTALFAGTLLAWRRVTRWGWIAFLGAWFFLLLAPSSSVVPIVTEIAAERRIYLALAAVMVLVVAAFAAGARRLRLSPAATGGAFACVLALLGVLTFRRSHLYADPERLWTDAVRVAPDNPRARDNLAATKFYSTPPRQAEARALYEQAIALDSTYVHAWPGLAAIAINEGRFADAASLLERVLRIQPGYADAESMLGRLFVRMGDPVRALPHLSAYAAAYPGEDAFATLGMAQLQAGQLREATTSLGAVLAQDPDRVDVMHFLGGAFVELGEGAKAIPLLERVAATTRGTPTDVGLLAIAYAQAGRTDDAKAAAEASSQLAPNDARVLLLAGRGMLAARLNDDAARYLTAAQRLAPASDEIRGYLARARAR
ncbi:MAG: tetratricopeptide repeat protein [Gemmatimonadaceae bacterium]